MESEYDYLFRVMLIGENSVGKSWLFIKYADPLFNKLIEPTIGGDIKIHNYDVDGKTIKL